MQQIAEWPAGQAMLLAGREVTDNLRFGLNIKNTSCDLESHFVSS